MSKRRPLKRLERPDWSDLRERLEAILKLQGRDDWQALRYLPPLPVLYNWAPLSREEREEFRADHGPSVFKGTSQRALNLDWLEHDVGPEGEDGYSRLVRCTLPEGVEAFLTVFVTLADLKGGRDLQRVTKPVKRLVREAVAECPTHDEAPGMLLVERPLVHTEPAGPWTAFHIAISGLQDVDGIVLAFTAALRDALNKPRPSVGFVPPEWRGLVHAQEETFLEDLRRYDRRFVEGYLPIQIAYLEQQRRLNKPVLARPGKIADKVRNESGVWESIDRIYYAVHAKHPRLRRERIDKPAEGAPPYSCGTLGHDGGRLCPEACPTWQRYEERTRPGLPTDTTGQERDELTARSDEGWKRWWNEGKFGKPGSRYEEVSAPSVEDEAERAKQPDPTQAARYGQARRLLDRLPRKTQAILLAHFGYLESFRAGEREKAGEAIRQLRDALGIKIPYPPTDGSRCVPGGCGCPLPRDWFSYNYRGFIDRTKGYRHLPEVKGRKEPMALTYPRCPRCGHPQDRANCPRCEPPVEHPETTYR